MPGLSLMYLLDIPSMIFVYGLTFFILLGIYKNDFIRFIPNALAVLFFMREKASPLYSEIALTACKVISIAAFTGCIVNGIMLRASMCCEDPSNINPICGFILLNIFYAMLGVIYLFFLSRVFRQDNSSIKPFSRKELIYISIFVLFCSIIFAFLSVLVIINVFNR